jgi:hypothetical protein
MRDGDEKTVRIGETRSKWRDAEAALHGASHIEALDEHGEVLRAWDIEPEDGAGGNGTSNMTQLAELARLLNEAADASAQRHEMAYRLAYEQQALLVKVMSERLQMLERAWHRLLMSEAGSAVDQNDPNAQLLTTLLGGAMNNLLAGAPIVGAAPKPKPNGAPPNGTR